MSDLRRTAPKSWRAWPPTLEQINALLERAARALAAQLTAEEWAQAGTILMAQPVDAPSLDLSFVGVEQEIAVGHVRALGKHTRWTVYWNPAEDTGRVHRTGGFDHRARWRRGPTVWLHRGPQRTGPSGAEREGKLGRR
jgi:hypothetical protein